MAAEPREAAWLTRLREALIRQGVSAEKIAQVVKEAIEAEKIQFNSGGQEVDRGPNHGIRLRAAALAADLHAPRPKEAVTDRPVIAIYVHAHESTFFGMPITKAMPVQAQEIPRSVNEAPKALTAGAGEQEEKQAGGNGTRGEESRSASGG